MKIFWAILARELRLALRHPADTLAAVFFFVIVAALFPFGVGPAPETLARLTQLGCAAEFAPGAAADAWIRQEMETWRRVVTAAGIRVD